jgi:hypothetical protein
VHRSCSSAAASSFTEETSHSSTSSCTTNIASAGLKVPLLLVTSPHCQYITSHMAWNANLKHVSKLFSCFKPPARARAGHGTETFTLSPTLTISPYQTAEKYSAVNICFRQIPETRVLYTTSVNSLLFRSSLRGML